MVTSVTNYLTEALTRLAAMEKEALTDAGYTPDAVPYFFHTQENFPYFTNRVDEDTNTGATEGATEEWEAHDHTVRARLVIAHLTEGVPGTPEGLLYVYMPLVTNFLVNHPLLQSAAYPTAMDILSPRGMTVERPTGFRIFNNAGFKVYQVGCEWPLRLPFNIPITEEY
jgi:hypothetical protein